MTVQESTSTQQRTVTTTLASSVNRVLAFLQLCLGVFSFASLLLSFLTVGLGRTIEDIIERYHSLVSGIGHLVALGLQYLVLPFNIHLTLNDQWMHVLIILNLYFFAHVSSAKRDALRAAAWFYRIWGALLALGFSLLVGILDLASDSSQALAFTLPVLAVLSFATGNSLRSAAFYRNAETTFGAAFGSPMRHVVRFGAAAAFLLAAAMTWRATTEPPPAQWGLPLLAAFTLTIALYRIWVNDDWVQGRADPSKSWWWRAKHTRQAHIGWGMLLVVACAIGLLAIGVGEDYLRAL